MKISQAFPSVFVSRLPLRCYARDPVTRNKPESKGGSRNVQETGGKIVPKWDGKPLAPKMPSFEKHGVQFLLEKGRKAVSVSL